MSCFVITMITNHTHQDVSDHLERNAVLALVRADDLKHVAALLGIGGLACKVVCCGDELPRNVATLRGSSKCARTVALNRLMVPAGGTKRLQAMLRNSGQGSHSEWLTDTEP